MAGLENTRPEDLYFERSREDVLSLLPTGYKKTLDVGCGAGGTASWLRAHGATTLHGIELVAEPAEQARQVMDHVWQGAVEEQLANVEGPYDAVLCLDVLEHLTDPYAVLASLREVTKPGGHLLVSLPNARNLKLAFDLVFRGTFGYTDYGHRDWTHLRWFTRKDASAAIEKAGFTVLKTSMPPSIQPLRAKVRSVPIVAELTNVQWYYVAQAR
ncbi:MAG: class I SAM-dependent methyltransferase [Solirubrobacteraceae bacterium]|nr:class I SAM-dependent methyltransferase [Patulibacter sp.]